ncbi:MAG: hypothetical protein M3R24_36560 [Chloroflexota bacterium]|nr:hypothetical protein [Chloroflexota bacterium]
MKLLTVRRGSVYDVHLVDANGQVLDVQRYVDIIVVYNMMEFAKAQGLAITHVD